MAAAVPATAPGTARHFDSSRQPNRHRTHLTTSQQKSSRKCVMCDGPHGPWNCKKFQDASVRERWELAKKHQLCFRCVGTGHSGQSRTRSATCGVDGCAYKHSRLLHPGPNRERPAASSNGRQPTANGAEVQQAASSKPSSNFVNLRAAEQVSETHTALRTVPVILKCREKRVQVNALLDDGSTQSYISNAAASILGLDGPAQTHHVAVLNGKEATLQTTAVECGLQSVDGSVKTSVALLTSDRPTGRMKPVDWQCMRQQWPHLLNIPFPALGRKPYINLLIGVDHAELHSAYDEVRGSPCEPVARKTPLGWTCIASPMAMGIQPATSFYAATLAHSDDVSNINQTLRKFWEVENVPSTNATGLSQDDLEVIKHTEETRRLINGRYEIGMPWKQPRKELPSNYASALRRLGNTEKRLERDSQLASQYGNVIQQYLDKGYIRRVLPEELLQSSPPAGWFLPHFPILRPDKSLPSAASYSMLLPNTVASRSMTACRRARSYRTM